MWIIIIRAVLSWVKVPSLYPLVVILHNLTEPVLRPFRKLVPPKTFGGIDITPIIVILLIYFVDAFLVKSISDIARQMVGEYRFSF
jgi:YggT family protein